VAPHGPTNPELEALAEIDKRWVFSVAAVSRYEKVPVYILAAFV